MMIQENITGLILAGGQARRMGGMDKGLIPFKGRPLIAAVIERLQPQVGRLMINANRHLDQYQRYNQPIVVDALPDYQGPLAGILAGLQAADTAYVAVAPCDCPFLPLDYVALLAHAINHSPPSLTQPAAVIVSQQGMEPLFCLLAKTHHRSLETYLSTGQRKVDTWLQQLPAIQVDCNPVQAFTNFNTPQDLASHLSSS